MKPTKMAVLFAVFGLAMFAAMPAMGAIINVDFEDLPITTYGCCGVVFTSGGVNFVTDQFQYEGGTWTPNGAVNVITTAGCGVRKVLWTGNANIIFDISGMPLRRLELDFGEYGGNLNVEINGTFKNIDQMMAIDNYNWGPATGPAISHVTLTGGNCGTLKVEGEITSFSIGGQEFEIDNVELETQQCFLGVVMQ